MLEVVSSKGRYRLIKHATGMWQIERLEGKHAFCMGKFYCEKAAKKAYKKL